LGQSIARGDSSHRSRCIVSSSSSDTSHNRNSVLHSQKEQPRSTVHATLRLQATCPVRKDKLLNLHACIISDNCTWNSHRPVYSNVNTTRMKYSINSYVQLSRLIKKTAQATVLLSATIPSSSSFHLTTRRKTGINYFVPFDSRSLTLLRRRNAWPPNAHMIAYETRSESSEPERDSRGPRFRQTRTP